MTKRIFRSTCLVAILVLLSAIVLIMSVLYEYFAILQKTELKEELIFAAKGVENDGTAYLHSLSLTNTRVTWIAKDGTVLFDSVVDPNELGAHEEREEIKEAFETGYGESVRYSDSLLARQLYVAERLSDGSVLRLSSPRASVLALLGGILFPTALFLLGAVLLSLFLSLGVSRKIVKPLNELDVDNLKREDVYEELKPLCDRLSTQKKHLAKQEATLRQKEDQFNAVTEGMREGILLIGPKRIILSANTAALHFFDLTKDAIGRDICAIAPKFRLEALLEEAERNRYAERYHQNDANLHHLIANPILSEGKTIGLCVVILDITEKNKIESLRREFTANVSHELKTPLHAISGYAELLLSGMVKEEDIPVFYQHIYDESGRMIRLVEDIIRLSSLDEGETESGSCSLDLFALASLAADSLRERAEKSGLTMTLEGTSVT
ncbi:MAG: PAS domain-containing sensor histidine kinase, partial [Clostridia bacterium]|nr:PAS domain-containing sensor histidine kinase [Clostridia bacterium]